MKGMLLAIATLDGPHLIGGLRWRIEESLQVRVSQGADHEKIAVRVAQVKRVQLRVVAQGLDEGFEQRHTLWQAVTLCGGCEGEQVEQVANRRERLLKVLLYGKLDLLGQLGAAVINNLAGLPVMKKTENQCAD